MKDAECQEKMGIVEHYAASLYSESEHHKWRMSSLPGADFLRLQILRALVAFHSRLFAIEAARRNGIDPDPTPVRPSRALPRRQASWLTFRRRTSSRSRAAAAAR